MTDRENKARIECVFLSGKNNTSGRGNKETYLVGTSYRGLCTGLGFHGDVTEYHCGLCTMYSMRAIQAPSRIAVRMQLSTGLGGSVLGPCG